MNGIDPDGMFWEELGNWLTGNGWTKTMDSPGDYWAQNMTESIVQQDVSEEISRFDYMDDLASGRLITPERPYWMSKNAFNELYNGPRGIGTFEKYHYSDWDIMCDNINATLNNPIVLIGSIYAGYGLYRLGYYASLRIAATGRSIGYLYLRNKATVDLIGTGTADGFLPSLIHPVIDYRYLIGFGIGYGTKYAWDKYGD